MMMVNTDDTLTSMSAYIDGGFFGGLLIGYALKKVIRMLAVVVGLFLAGLAFLQYQQIATIHWHKVEGAITKLAAAATTSTLMLSPISICMYNMLFYIKTISLHDAIK
jgi:uncharacterized membrane protein (Fun14 family)